MKVAVRPNPELETQIDVAYNHFLAAKDDSERRRHWETFAALLAKRSPMRVRRMERDMGLDKRATFVPREQSRK